MRLRVELVPRDEASLAAQLGEVAGLTRVDTINVPDLSQFTLGGWRAAAQVRAAGAWWPVPHVRATELAGNDSAVAQIVGGLPAAGSRAVRVVSGDQGPAAAPGAPSPVARAGAGVTPALAAIRLLKAAAPTLTVYAALDPYRSGFAEELAYAEAKLEAGADGLFTQPFFDLRLLDVWRELTSGVQVFWGVTSVTSPRSQRYWLSRNRAVFPSSFEPTLAWHRDLAARVVDDVATYGGNLYFMPIKVGIVDWLGDLLG